MKFACCSRTGARVASTRRFDRRTLLRGAAAAGAAAAASSIAGCGDNDDALTFFFQAKPDEAKVRLEIIDEFRKLHPDIKIRTQMSGPDPQTQILTYCAGGKCPDVLMSWDLSYSFLAERGIFENLDTILDKDPVYAAELKKDSSMPLYNTFRYKNAQHALPEQWAGIFLYYNRKLFADAKLAPPPTRWEDAWSFDEFLGAAQALTKRDSSGDVIQWGFVDPWTVYYSASCFGMNNGIEWFTPSVDPTRTNIDNDAFIEGVQFYTDLSTKHRVMPTIEFQQSLSSSDMFAQGKAAMALSGHWMYSTYAGQGDLDFDVTVLPVGPRGTAARSDIGTTGLSIAADSPRKEQAWEFVKFATGPVGQAVIAKSGLFVPALKSALGSDGFAQAHAKVHNLEVFHGGDHANNLPVTPAWPRVDAVIQQGYDHVFRGAASAEWFKHGLARQINDLLEAQ
ncbi:sugar ABC transporter substrate-binding protein [Nocardia nova]|uniref:ABC transporter substrate-binding protein n=1 Tax=Nocardia nova TaxID=37330 RepID=UPI001C48879F|nr:sugar ABC transporter substrate-binding protein [Nocardia nova]